MLTHVSQLIQNNPLESAFTNFAPTISYTEVGDQVVYEVHLMRTYDTDPISILPDLALPGLDFDLSFPSITPELVWELDEPQLRPIDVIDELLVMAMPFSAMHDDAKQCTLL